MSQMAYAWRPGTRSPVKAQIAGEEITRIRSKQGKFFSPAAVVLSARSNNSPLHAAFEWDDSKAAIEHREYQARKMIGAIVVVNPNDPEAQPVRAFVSVRLEDDSFRFTTVAHAMSEDALREQVLAQARNDIHAFERKYARFMDLSGVVAALKASHAQALARPAHRLAS